MERLGLTSSRRRRPEPQDRSPYPENLRAIIYKYGLQGESVHWVNEHWDDGRYFPTIERHGVTRALTEKMHEAAEELPRFDPATPLEERVELWQANRAQIESDLAEYGEARVRYSLFIFGARTVENFSSKIYALLEMPFTEDGVGWVMFDSELRNIAGLMLP